ncbi:MAG: NAD-dependent 4,6-dehydratase LegB [Alphaproteobacteria bacterium]
MATILVTGAGGFIGSHLVEALVATGHQVRAFVRYNAQGSWGWLDHLSQDVLANVDVRLSDIRDAHAVRDAMQGCETVFHLAALISIPYSYQAPQSYLDTNVAGTLNIVQAATDLGVARVIHTSTSEVYGTAQYVPIDEQHRLHPQSPYAASKVGADQLALSFHRSFATPVVVLRPFNTYGPRQSDRAVIPTIITQLAAGARTLTLGALTPTRDFNFVADTVRGFIAAAGSPAAIGEVINIGSDFEVSIGDTAAMITDIMGVEAEITTDPARVRPTDSEVERLWADNGRAAELMQWRPQYGGREGFRRGLEETIAWFAEPANRAGYRPQKYSV